MKLFDLSSYLSRKRDSIEAALKAWVDPTAHENHRLAEAMAYSLMAGGKRMRPVLCIAAAESVGGGEKDALPGACAVEMIHTYSLIHDDLPAMDDDTLRRGKPTCHVAFDEATAVLAGDALLTLAFEVLATYGLSRGDRPGKTLEVIRILSHAAGPSGMVRGQMEDMAAQGASCHLNQLRHMHALKTGALIVASVEIGAILGGGSEDRIHKLKHYAHELGLAFQIIDDVLNVEGDPRIMGKATGTDSLKKKSTYPALMGVEASKALAKACIDSALHALKDFDTKAEPLRAIAAYVLERKR